MEYKMGSSYALVTISILTAITNNTCRIQPLILSYLHRNNMLIVGDICTVTKSILKKLFKE